MKQPKIKKCSPKAIFRPSLPFIKVQTNKGLVFRLFKFKKVVILYEYIWVIEFLICNLRWKSRKDHQKGDYFTYQFCFETTVFPYFHPGRNIQVFYSHLMRVKGVICSSEMEVIWYQQRQKIGCLEKCESRAKCLREFFKNPRKFQRI